MVKTSYTLHGMEKNTKYLIRVEAEGQNGLGPSSEELQATTFTDVPSGVPQKIRIESNNPRSIRIWWLPPPSNQQNGPIIGYKIRYKTKQRNAKGITEIVNGDPGVYLLEDGIEPGTHYTFRIAATTQVDFWNFLSNF